MSNLSCPHCGIFVVFDSSRAGQPVVCPGCRRSFTMPEMGLPIADPAPPPLDPFPVIETSPFTEVKLTEHTVDLPSNKPTDTWGAVSNMCAALAGGVILLSFMFFSLFSCFAIPIAMAGIVASIYAKNSASKITGLVLNIVILTAAFVLSMIAMLQLRAIFQN